MSLLPVVQSLHGGGREGAEGTKIWFAWWRVVALRHTAVSSSLCFPLIHYISAFMYQITSAQCRSNIRIWLKPLVSEKTKIHHQKLQVNLGSTQGFPCVHQKLPVLLTVELSSERPVFYISFTSLS